MNEDIRDEEWDAALADVQIERRAIERAPIPAPLPRKTAPKPTKPRATKKKPVGPTACPKFGAFWPLVSTEEALTWLADNCPISGAEAELHTKKFLLHYEDQKKQDWPKAWRYWMLQQEAFAKRDGHHNRQKRGPNVPAAKVEEKGDGRTWEYDEL